MSLEERILLLENKEIKVGILTKCKLKKNMLFIWFQIKIPELIKLGEKTNYYFSNYY